MDVILYSKISKLDKTVYEGKTLPSINLFNPNDSDIINGGYLDGPTGQFVEYSGYFESGYIEGNAGDTFTFTYDGDYLGTNVRHTCFYNANKEFVTGGSPYLPTITLPEGCKYMRIALQTSKVDTLMIVRNDTSILPYVSYDDVTKIYGIDTTVNGGVIGKSINLFNPSDKDMLTGGKYIDIDGTIKSMSDHNESGFIPCIAGNTLTLTKDGSYFTSQRPIVFYDENKDFVYGQNYNMPTITVSSEYGDRIRYARVPIKNNELAITMIVKNDTAIHPYVPFGDIVFQGLTKDVEELLALDKSWTGKSVVLLGDSITYNDGHNGLKGYPYYIKALGFKTITNKGVNGACVAYHSERQYEDICTTVDSIDFTKYDLVTIAGGINDYNTTSASPIGTLINSATITDFTKTDFIGGLQYIITKILNSNPSIKIALFTPLKKSGWYNANSEGKVLKDYVDAIKEVAEYYSTPVLDFYSMSGINRKNFSTFLSDGLHPNNAGYEYVSRKLVAFIGDL